MEGDDLCSSKVKNKQPYPASALAKRPPMKGALNEDILYCHSDTWKALRKTMMRYVYEGLDDFCYPKVNMGSEDLAKLTHSEGAHYYLKFIISRIG